MGWAIRLKSQSRDTNPRDLGLGKNRWDKNLGDRSHSFMLVLINDKTFKFNKYEEF